MQDKFNKRYKFIMTILIVLMIVTFFIMLSLGRYYISFSDILHSLSNAFSGKNTLSDSNIGTVLINIRLPRVLLAIMVGASLSLAGCTFQSIFHNPMASPDILGASSGACFGAALAILNNRSRTETVIWAFGFSLITVGVVFLISLRTRGNRTVTLILVGIIVSSLFSSATSYIKLVSDQNNQLPAITYWMMGSLSGATLQDVIISLIPMGIPAVVLLILRWKINLLTLSDEEAVSIGVNVRLLRYSCILLASLMTAACISVSGLIGWVGLIIPNLARMITGNNTKRLFPLSLLMGGLFLLIIDGFSRCLMTTEIPIGILNSFIGAPFFILILFREGRKS